MTNLFRQLRLREQRGQPVGVAVIGAGFMGRGIVYQLSRMPGLRAVVSVDRDVDRAVQAFVAAGFRAADVCVSDDPQQLSHAAAQGRPAASATPEIAAAVQGVEVVLEATGHVEGGAREALSCLRHRKHFVSFNAETDATVGCVLKSMFDAAGLVYTNGDGDQPGVLMRMIDYCRGCAFQVRAAVNCKGFMDIRATPESIKPWAIKQNTSPRMTCAFTDGTKMNIEQNVVCNAAALLPAKRGMFGVKTDLKNAIGDFHAAGALTDVGSVDYTLGGDFAGGVFVIGYADHPQMVQPYMRYLKMGNGPDYMFYRGYHLCHIEAPLSAAEAVIYGQPTIAPLGRPLAHTVAVAKRDLQAGEVLDGIGGFLCYGQVDAAANCQGLLPMGLAEGVRLCRPVKQDNPVPLDAVELDESRLIVKLWKEQARM